jgi:pyruvate dehydrogenase complex dehydrogenase (E1) component
MAAHATRDLTAPSAELLRAVEQRVLWIAMSIVHHANKVRANTSGVKVGGHQPSSASMVSIMTAPWFAHLRAPDRVSVKPHASPVLHAINYLLGALDAKYLTTLRARRAAELPEPHQGPRPRRLLDRLGRHRRHRDDLERARAPLRRRPRRRRGRRPPDRAARRRRA